MTTAAMALGAVPLIVSSGAGAVSRNHLGMVIATGINIGTLFTLFVVPAMYLFLAQDRCSVTATGATPSSDHSSESMLGEQSIAATQTR